MQPDFDHPQTVEQAAAILRGGDVCAFATETVYGLGADATNPDAVLKIYETKGRPRFNPLIVHCATLAMAESLVIFDTQARKIADAFWPGPVSLVLPLRPDADIADLVTAGLTTLAVRIPATEQARALIEAAGRPIAAPSANPSGKLSATSAEQVRKGFGDRVPVLDGGPCTQGLESTILTFIGDKIVQLRAGALPVSEVETSLRRSVDRVGTNEAISAPGMMLSHYAPHTPIRLNVSAPRDGEAFLAFGPTEVKGDLVLNLSPTSDLREAARNLFSMLHKLDALAALSIAVAPIPTDGLGEAINDRLVRAAAPKDAD